MNFEEHQDSKDFNVDYFSSTISGNVSNPIIRSHNSLENIIFPLPCYF